MTTMNQMAKIVLAMKPKSSHGDEATVVAEEGILPEDAPVVKLVIPTRGEETDKKSWNLVKASVEEIVDARFGLEVVGVTHRVIMIAVTAGSNQSSFNVGLLLYRWQMDKIILHTVHEGPDGSALETEFQMKQRFSSILSKPNTSLFVDVKPPEHDDIVNTTLTAMCAHKPHVIVMGMDEGAKRLGPVMQAVLNVSNTNLLVVKRMAPAMANKIYFLGVNGNHKSTACVHKLIPLLDANDEVIAVIVSKTQSQKDKKVLETMDAMMAEAGVKKHRAVFIMRDMAVTVGQQLLSTAHYMEADVIVCATGTKASSKLGSTSTHLLLNAQQHVLVLKVPTFFSSDNLEFSGAFDRDALYQ